MPETLLYDSMLLPSVQALLLWCLLVPGFFEWYGDTFAMLILLTPSGLACGHRLIGNPSGM